MSAPPAIGHGANEWARTYNARKTYTCNETTYHTLIQPGEDYVRATTFPDHEIVGGAIRLWRFCVPCATRYGRPLPPVSDGAAQVDPEAVRIAVSGQRVVRLNVAERREAVRQLRAGGMSARETGRRVGVTARTVLRIQRRIERAEASRGDA
jgi:hypothetical protein